MIDKTLKMDEVIVYMKGLKKYSRIMETEKRKIVLTLHTKRRLNVKKIMI